MKRETTTGKIIHIWEKN